MSPCNEQSDRCPWGWRERTRHRSGCRRLLPAYCEGERRLLGLKGVCSLKSSTIRGTSRYSKSTGAISASNTKTFPLRASGTADRTIWFNCEARSSLGKQGLRFVLKNDPKDTWLSKEKRVVENPNWTPMMILMEPLDWSKPEINPRGIIPGAQSSAAARDPGRRLLAHLDSQLPSSWSTLLSNRTWRSKSL
jgi:hypothetical protein